MQRHTPGDVTVSMPMRASPSNSRCPKWHLKCQHSNLIIKTESLWWSSRRERIVLLLWTLRRLTYSPGYHSSSVSGSFGGFSCGEFRPIEHQTMATPPCSPPPCAGTAGSHTGWPAPWQLAWKRYPLHWEHVWTGSRQENSTPEWQG